MKINIFLERENKNKVMDSTNGITVKALLEKLKLNSSAYVVAVNNEIVLNDCKLKENDRVEVFSVVSGG